MYVCVYKWKVYDSNYLYVHNKYIYIYECVCLWVLLSLCFTPSFVFSVYQSLDLMLCVCVCKCRDTLTETTSIQFQNSCLCHNSRSVNMICHRLEIGRKSFHSSNKFAGNTPYFRKQFAVWKYRHTMWVYVFVAWLAHTHTSAFFRPLCFALLCSIVYTSSQEENFYWMENTYLNAS